MVEVVGEREEKVIPLFEKKEGGLPDNDRNMDLTKDKYN